MTSATTDGLDFDARYTFEVNPELSGLGEEPFVFSRTDARAGGGLLVRVMPNEGTPWLGRFQWGDEGLTGVYRTPNDSVLCAIARGRAYLVDAFNPRDPAAAACEPVRVVKRALAPKLLLLADYTKIAAYGTTGLAWVSDPVSWDGVEITEIGNELLAGRAWDPALGKRVPFVVDLRTGSQLGGSVPPGVS